MEKFPKSLSTEVFRRFLTKEQLENLLGKYEAGKIYNAHGSDRSATLSKKVTEEELELLRAYLQDTDTSLEEIIAGTRFHKRNVSYHVGRIALRYMFQNDLI